MKKQTLTQAKDKLWKVFSQYIRLRDALRTTGTETHGLCISCEKHYPCFGVGCMQAGHFLPGRHASVIYDERGCQAQCYNCNVNLKGNWNKYYAGMEKLYGEKIIKELQSLDRETKQWKVFEIEELTISYKEKLKKLSQQ